MEESGLVPLCATPFPLARDRVSARIPGSWKPNPTKPRLGESANRSQFIVLRRSRAPRTTTDDGADDDDNYPVESYRPHVVLYVMCNVQTLVIVIMSSHC